MSGTLSCGACGPHETFGTFVRAPFPPDRLMMRRSERGSNQQDVTVARRSKQLEMRENFFFRRHVARQSPPSDVVQIRVGS
jgi:hypothetical protein